MKLSQRPEIEELFLAHSAGLLRYLSLHTANRDDAEDLLQDVFINCCRYWERYDPDKASGRAWLFMIARNRLKNYYRDRKPADSLDWLVEISSIDVADDFSQQAIRLLEHREMLAGALTDLPRRSREIVVLRYFGGRSIDEIARSLNLSSGNVRVILVRAKKQMEAFLRENGWEEN